MKISDRGKEFIKTFEGLRLKAYRDSAGIWTIGYGSTKYVNGKAVQYGEKLANEEQADELFLNTLSFYEKAVNTHVKVPISQHQFDALVSITYNVGVGIMAKSTLITKLNNSDVIGAAQQFLVWNKITDPVSLKKVACDALTKRRLAERQLFLK